jgi:hypothetical protein
VKRHVYPHVSSSRLWVNIHFNNAAHPVICQGGGGRTFYAHMEIFSWPHHFTMVGSFSLVELVKTRHLYWRACAKPCMWVVYGVLEESNLPLFLPFMIRLWNCSECVVFFVIRFIFYFYKPSSVTQSSKRPSATR